MRVRSGKFARIAKEVDRLEEDEGAAVEPEHPFEYERDGPGADIDCLAHFPQVAIARDLGLDGTQMPHGDQKARSATSRNS
jgi:hypothetical protein